MVAAKKIQTGKSPVLRLVNTLALAIVLLAAGLLWLAPAPALASGMALADEDMLSDVSAQVGMGLVLEGGGNVGVIAYRGQWTTTARTGSLSYRNVSITGPGAGGRFSLGLRTDAAQRVNLDVGTNAAGTQTRMRLRFPNMFASGQYVTISAAQSWAGWHTGAAASYQNFGSFTLGQIMHNHAQITMWAGNGGVRGIVDLSTKIGLVQNIPRAGAARGFRFDNTVFSGTFPGTITDPGNNPGTGYASFGTETGTTPRVMSIDVYTDENVTTRTRMRIAYTTTGIFWIQRTGIIDTAGNWIRDNAGRGTYGPVVLGFWRPSPHYNTGSNPGHIVITNPIRHGTFRWVGP